MVNRHRTPQYRATKHNRVVLSSLHAGKPSSSSAHNIERQSHRKFAQPWIGHHDVSFASVCTKCKTKPTPAQTNHKQYTDTKKWFGLFLGSVYWSHTCFHTPGWAVWVGVGMPDTTANRFDVGVFKRVFNCNDIGFFFKFISICIFVFFNRDNKTRSLTGSSDIFCYSGCKLHLFFFEYSILLCMPRIWLNYRMPQRIVINNNCCQCVVCWSKKIN